MEWNDPHPGQYFVYHLSRLLLTALLIAGLALLWRIVRAARSGDVFGPANARRLTALSLLVLIGGTLREVVEFMIADWLLGSSPVRGAVAAPIDFSLTPIWLGMLLVFFAAVFRHGVRLREDVAGLV